MSKEINELYYKCFRSEIGLQVLQDLEKRVDFTPDTSSTNDTFYRLGRASLVKEIKNIIKGAENDRRNTRNS